MYTLVLGVLYRVLIRRSCMDPWLRPYDGDQDVGKMMLLGECE